MICVIAEKPSVAKEYAKVIGGDSLQKKDGYMEGNGYTFTWAFGHLIELCMPSDYGFQSYIKENLPLVPEPFKTQIKTISKETKVDGKKTYLKVPDPGVQKQLKIIETLFNNCTEIYVGTDAGREGELIFRYIYEYFQCKKPFKRIWISSQTDKAIKEGFENVKPGSEYNLIYEAARSRSEADWLVGINASQALAIAVNAKGVSLGRVQTPTLAMICARFEENNTFKAVPYFQLRGQLDKDGKQFHAISTNTYKTKESATERLITLQGESSAIVASVEQKEKKEQPPLLHDLTSLQQEANKKHGFSADNTLKVAQTLYEKKLTTYPRTGSRYIGEDVFDTIPSLINNAKSLGIYPEKAFNDLSTSLNDLCVNAEKVTDHHALLPTETKYSASMGLSDDEKIIYQMIVGRMLEAFNSVCIKEIQTIKLLIKEEEFKVFGTVVKKEGWRSVAGSVQDEEANNPDEENAAILPSLTANEKIINLGVVLLEKETKPKPIHTEASLLKAMETCGKDIADEAIREAMKEGGLGTPATRASIIETLFSREYIERKKKLLVPTTKGLGVYKLVKDKKIAAPELTGEWEKFLNLIEKNKISPDKFMDGIKQYSKLIVKEILENTADIKLTDFEDPKQEHILCPKCKKGNIKSSDTWFFCSEYQNGCDFKLWNEIAGKKLTTTLIKTICEKGQTSVIKNFKGKNKAFDAALKLKEDFSGIEFIFAQKK